MKKIIGKTLTIIITAILTVGMLPTTGEILNNCSDTYTAKAFTLCNQDRAIEYARNLVGKKWDFDKTGSYDCVDILKLYFYEVAGFPNKAQGNAGAYATSAILPDGWQRKYVSNGYKPQPGDVAVWDFNAYMWNVQLKWGHVGVVVEVNGDQVKLVDQDTSAQRAADYNSYRISDVTCFINPDFKCKTHTWDKGKETKSAKCTKNKLVNGEKVFTCTVCGEKKKEVIKASHSYKTKKTTRATLKKNGKVIKKCKKCGKTISTAIQRPKTIKMKKSLIAYNGKYQKPRVIVKDAKSKAIPTGSYRVFYKNNKKIGTATATVKFKGKCIGTKKLTFKIGPKGSSINKIAGGFKKVTVRWTRNSGIDGYQVQYSTRKDFKTQKTITIKGNKKNTTTINNLGNGKTYYVRVRTYKVIKKKKHVSPWSETKFAKTIIMSEEDIAGNKMGEIIKYLRGKNVTKVRSLNAELPATIEESCVKTMSADMKSAYRKEIQAWENKTNSMGNYYFSDYWLTDVDNDGLTDLLLSLQPDMADARIAVYRYVNGSIMNMGNIYGATCHAYPKHNGVVLEDARQGYNWFSLVTYSNGQLKTEQLCTLDFTSGGNNIGLRNNLKSHRQWNGSRYVPVYSDLN